MRSEPYCCACGVESCRCGAGGKVAEMDNEQVRVCRCCGEAETHRDGCREMMAADPLHGPRRVWDRQKAEMSAGEAVRVRSIFGLYGEKVDRTVLSSAGHASKQAMLDAPATLESPADVCRRMTGLQPVNPVPHVRRCSTCAWYDEFPLEPYQAACSECGARDGEAHRLVKRPTFPNHMKCYRGQGQATFTARRAGLCRAHSPSQAGFPKVRSADWCGDHKLSEEAVR
jgi:hypothetical protein